MCKCDGVGFKYARSEERLCEVSGFAILHVEFRVAEGASYQKNARRGVCNSIAKIFSREDGHFGMKEFRSAPKCQEQAQTPCQTCLNPKSPRL